MLARILSDAARGVFPADDGSVTVVPQPAAREAGVIAFTAHAVVFTDEDPDWVRKAVRATPADPLAAPMSPFFLTELAARTGRVMNTIDLLTVADRLPGDPPVELREVTDPDHPRFARALLYRDEVRAWQTAAGGMVMLGRGVAGRWEAAIEVEPGARERGLGRALAVAARHLVPEGEVVWAQQAPGNARSVRTFQAAGYRPVGSEALLTRVVG